MPRANNVKPIDSLRGSFIVLEGADCTGTTTQAKRLVQHSNEVWGIPAVFTAEPYPEGTLHKLIREILGGGHTEQLGSLTPNAHQAYMALLFSADRIEHFRTFIKPQMDAGNLVVCDRYSLSTFVYQYSGHKVAIPNLPWLQSLTKYHVEAPYLTLVLNTNLKTTLERMDNRGGAKEIYEHTDLLEQTIGRYCVLPAHIDEADTIYAPIDATADEEAVFQSILTLVRRYYNMDIRE